MTDQEFERELIRLREIESLEDGYLDGEAFAPSRQAIAASKNLLEAIKGCRRPFLYPNPLDYEGPSGVNFEWGMISDDFIIEVTVLADGTYRAEGQFLNDGEWTCHDGEMFSDASSCATWVATATRS
jgi:hypothetical protein